MSGLPDAVFHLDGDRAVPTELARGPWSPLAMHGGAPAALIARAVERHDPSPANFVGRLTIELLRPVPLLPLELDVRTIRPGKKVQWIAVTVTADGTEVVRATALRVRTDPALRLAVPEPPRPRSLRRRRARRWSSTSPIAAGANSPSSGSGASSSCASPSARSAPSVPRRCGSGSSCPSSRARSRRPCSASRPRPTSATASAPCSTTARDSFINADLTISLHRLPEGEWVGIDSVTHASPDGVGTAESVLLDERGRLGRALQTLLMDRA